MALFLMTYELRQHKDYRRLTDRLKELGGIHVMNSAWALSREGSVDSILKEVRCYVDDDDRVAVAEVKHIAATSNVPPALWYLRFEAQLENPVRKWA